MNGLSGAYPRNFSNFTHNDEHDTILGKYHLSTMILGGTKQCSVGNGTPSRNLLTHRSRETRNSRERDIGHARASSRAHTHAYKSRCTI